MTGVLKFSVRKRPTGPTLSCAKDAVEYLRDIGDLMQEVVVVVLLTAKNRVLGREIVSMGSVSATIARAADIYRPAVIAGAASIVVAHNHPSGVATPSREDMMLTENLRKAGDALGIKFLDHIIIGDDSFFAMSDLPTM